MTHVMYFLWLINVSSRLYYQITNLLIIALCEFFFYKAYGRLGGL